MVELQYIFMAQLWEMGLCIPPLPILSCGAACKSYLIQRVHLTALSLCIQWDTTQYSAVQELLKQLT